jgi:hypothetical protein
MFQLFVLIFMIKVHTCTYTVCSIYIYISLWYTQCSIYIFKFSDWISIGTLLWNESTVHVLLLYSQCVLFISGR